MMFACARHNPVTRAKASAAESTPAGRGGLSKSARVLRPIHSVIRYYNVPSAEEPTVGPRTNFRLRVERKFKSEAISLPGHWSQLRGWVTGSRST